MSNPAFLDRAGRWFLNSGIQDPIGGVARYYRSDIERNNPISTEITGYAVSTLAYLHGRTGNPAYLERAVLAGDFLGQKAWDAQRGCFPFEYGAGADGGYTYFFDTGIIIRALLALWRATCAERYLEAAQRAGHAMARDFADARCENHPILRLPGKEPLEHNPLRWSRSTGCYQLKSAMAWHDLFEATGEAGFEPYYCRALDAALRDWGAFLPGHPERTKVMDRLHAFSYFLEGMLPCAGQPRCAGAIREGIGRVAGYVREIGPEFERSDVYAQLLRMRIYADWAGVTPVDRDAAAFEAAKLAGFQCEAADPRIDGGFWFGRRGGEWLPYVNPVSAGFGLQALDLWEAYLEGGPRAHRHDLI